MEPDEKDLLQSFEDAEWQPVPNSAELIAKLKQAAKKMSDKDFRLNIRVSKSDINAIKVKALQEGIPYQTLIASVLHKYAKGRLTER